MDTKFKYKLKQEKGVLHVGGGRFFYPGESYELTDAEVEMYEGYFDVSDEQEGKKTVSLKKNSNNK